MKNNLIYDIKEALEFYNLKCVNISFSYNVNIAEIACAVALRDFLKQIGVKANIIVDPKDEEEFPRFLKDYKTEVEPNTFLSVLLNCQDYCMVQTMKALDSFILFNVCAPSPYKDFGVKNYTEKKGSSTAQLLFNHIERYAKHEDVPLKKPLCDLLYLGIVSATKRYQKNINPDVMDTAKRLLEYGAEYKACNHVSEFISPEVFACQRDIFDNLIVENNIGFAIMDKTKGRSSYKSYTTAMEFFRNYDNIALLACFIPTKNSTFKLIVHGRYDLKFDYSLLEQVISSEIDIDETDAMMEVPSSKLVSVIEVLSTVYKESKKMAFFAR